MFEFYADIMEVRVSENPGQTTIGVSFGLSMDGPQYKQRLLLSEANAKKLVLLLKKLLRVREEVEGHPIALEEEFYKKVGIAPEDY